MITAVAVLAVVIVSFPICRFATHVTRAWLDDRADMAAARRFSRDLAASIDPAFRCDHPDAAALSEKEAA